MAHVLALIPDLLFGSRVRGALTAAGHRVDLLADPGAAAKRLAGCELLIVDLTGDLDGAALVEKLSSEGVLEARRTLGFYAHVDQEVRARAQRAGFDLVVPRSRMAREAGKLLEDLLGSPSI
jgi:hypothetical protein